jgi:hypothetical protein
MSNDWKELGRKLTERRKGIQEKHIRIAGVLDRIQTGYHTNKSQKRYNFGECVQYDNDDDYYYYDHSASLSWLICYF